MLRKFLYTGPSWATSSFPLDKNTTNLPQQWGFDHTDISAFGEGNHGCFRRVKSRADGDVPIVWVYCEPLLSLGPATGMSMAEFVVSDNWRAIRETCNQYCLELINSLPNPVFLIGSHSDIVNFNNHKPTLQIGEASWQKWIAQQSGLVVDGDSIHVTPKDGGNYNFDLRWGADMVHKFLHENPNIDPAPSLLDAIWDVYYFWQYLEEQQWFFEVHPNRRGNVEFAEFLKPKIEQFLTTLN
jgi:hypothetical protein